MDLDYDVYIDRVAEQLEVDAFNQQELKIIEGCFERNWEISVAANLIETHWKNEEEDYNSFGDYD